MHKGEVAQSKFGLGLNFNDREEPLAELAVKESKVELAFVKVSQLFDQD